MNKHLNNWLDKQEGLPEETSNNNIKKEMSLSKEQEKMFGKYAQSAVNNLNRNVKNEQID